MDIVALNENNIESEHICCAFSDKKTIEGYAAKKEYLKSGIPHGLIFKKLNVKHKVFIEYSPAETAWLPVDAPGYTAILCFWVAGQYKDQGYGKALLEECIHDSKDNNGVIVISTAKKKPFFTDKSFFLKHGFTVCDSEIGRASCRERV